MTASVTVRSRGCAVGSRHRRRGSPCWADGPAGAVGPMGHTGPRGPMGHPGHGRNPWAPPGFPWAGIGYGPYGYAAATPYPYSGIPTSSTPPRRRCASSSSASARRSSSQTRRRFSKRSRSSSSAAPDSSFRPRSRTTSQHQRHPRRQGHPSRVGEPDPRGGVLGARGRRQPRPRHGDARHHHHDLLATRLPLSRRSRRRSSAPRCSKCPAGASCRLISLSPASHSPAPSPPRPG